MVLNAKTLLEVDPLTTGLQEIVERQECNEDDLLALRHVLYRSSPIGQEKVALLFDAHQKMPVSDSLWGEFFIEATAEVFLTRRHDQIVIDDQALNQLLDAIGGSPTIDDPGHRRLALQLLLRSTKPPEWLRALFFHTVREHLVKENRRLLINLPREPGTVDVVDMHLIRKLVLGAGGQYPTKVNLVAVNFLLALDEAPLTFTDPGAWETLLLKIVSSHVLTEHPCQDTGHGGIDQAAASRLIQHIRQRHQGHHEAQLIAHLTGLIETDPGKSQLS